MNLLHILTRLARRGLLPLSALFALLALLGTQALPVSAATTPSFIRLINASQDVGTVDVFVDGVKFLENAHFASVTDYLQLPSGPHKVQLALIGKGLGAATMAQLLSVQAGAAYTVAATGTKATGLSLQVFVDDNRMVSGKATVRVYDLSPLSGALNVTAGTNKPIGFISYRQASNYQSLTAGLYTFTFSSTQPAFTLFDQVALKTDMVTSFFLVGVLNGAPPLQVVHVQVMGLPRLLAGTGSDPHALPVNASEFAPLIALSLGVLAFAVIAVGLSTRFWPFSRQKGSSRLRPRPGELVRAALGGILALALSLGGLSLAFFMTHPAPAPSSARLLIPAIGVNTTIESVGVRTNGEMDTARQSPWRDVGLYTGGSRPGDRGSAAIAGHLDRPGGNPAVFWRLHELHVGDEVQIVTAQGKILLFHVTHIEAYPVQDAPVQDIFGNTTGRFLNLTTCAGDWIQTQHQRAIRLVVYTSFGPAPANTSTVTSSGSLTLPSSSSNLTSSTGGRSSSSSSVSSAPTRTTTPSPLPAAIRQPVTVKLPGVSQQGSRQPTRIPVGGWVLRQTSTQLTRILGGGKVLSQTGTQLTQNTSVGGKVSSQTSTQLTQNTSVGGKVSSQTNTQLTQNTSVGDKVSSQTSTQLTQNTSVGDKVSSQTNTQLTQNTSVGDKVSSQTNTQVTQNTSVGDKVSSQTNTQVTQNTSVGDKVSSQTNTQVTQNTSVGDKVSSQTSTQVTQNTSVGDKVSSQTNTQVTSQTNTQGTSQTNTQVSSQTNTQVTSQTGTQVTSQTGTQGTSQTNTQVTSQTNTQGTSQTNTQVTSQTNTQGTSQTNTQGTSQTGTQVTSQTNTQGTSQTNTQVTSQTGTQGTSQTNTQVTSQTGTQGTSQTGTQVTSQTNTQGTSQTGTQVTSQTGTQGTSQTGTQVTSQTNTQVTQNTSGGGKVHHRAKG